MNVIIPLRLRITQFITGNHNQESKTKLKVSITFLLTGLGGGMGASFETRINTRDMDDLPK